MEISERNSQFDFYLENNHTIINTSNESSHNKNPLSSRVVKHSHSTMVFFMFEVEYEVFRKCHTKSKLRNELRND